MPSSRRRSPSALACSLPYSDRRPGSQPVATPRSLSSLVECVSKTISSTRIEQLCACRDGHEVRVRVVERHLRRLGADPELLELRHQALVREALESLLRLPHVEHAQAVFEPRYVEDPALGGVVLPVHGLTRAVVVVAADARPLHLHHGRHRGSFPQGVARCSHDPRRRFGAYVGPVARTRSRAAATPSRHGSPWPTATTPASTSWSFVSESRHFAELPLNARGMSCGPRAPVNGLSVQSSSPAMRARAASK